MDHLPSYQHSSGVSVPPSNDDDTIKSNSRNSRRLFVVLVCCTLLLLLTWGSRKVFSSSGESAMSSSLSSVDADSIALLGKSKRSEKDESSSSSEDGKPGKKLKNEASSSDRAKEERKEEKKRKKEEKRKAKAEAKAAKKKAKEEKERQKEADKAAKAEQKAQEKAEKAKEKEAAKEKKAEEKEKAKADKPPHHHFPFAMFQTLIDLDAMIDGDVLFPWNWTLWDEAKHVWNKNAHSPLIVIEVENEKDVQAVVPVLAKLQVNYSFPFRVRSGGHNYAGYSTVKGGAILSLSRMNSTKLSNMEDVTDTAIATVQPAVKVLDVLQQILIPHGYSGVIGVCPGVAESGHALNGGIGYLSRKYGLGLDSIRGLRIVLADGSVAKASATENADLFFALRGAGGGNFGVVTEIEYLVHKSQDTQLIGAATMAYEDLGSFFQFLGEHDSEIPGEVLTFMESTGDPEVLINWFGPDDISLEAGKKFLEEDLPAMLPFNVTVEVEPTSWVESTIAGGNLEGNYAQAWNGFLFADNNTVDIWDEMIGQIVAGLESSDYLMTDIEHWGGAIGAVDTGETAFPYRDALFNVGILLLVPNTTINATTVYQEEVDKISAWWPSVSQYLTGTYLNYQMESLSTSEYPRSYWGSNLDRLIALKNQYDPMNVFNFEQSLPLSMPE